jgi:glyoxylate reductase
MGTSKVLLTTRIPSSVLTLLESRHTVDQYAGEGAIPRDELLRRVADKDALICMLTEKIDGEVMDAAPGLKIVANIAVGYDNLDLPAARKRGIPVTNTPDVLTEATAELTWALILGIARRVAEGDRLIRAGAWKRWGIDFMLGMELRGKQLGIVGAGRIGRAVAAKAPAFGMRVVFARRERTGATGEAVAQWSEPKRGAGGNRGVAAAPSAEDDMSLDELLVTSDVVSLHAPSTPETRHLINKRTLARMKRSAILVNTARGALVDEEALAWALGERLIAGAALDVYEREPGSYPALKDFENVLLSPHLGSATRETRTAMAELAVRNVLAVLNGDEPLTPIP